MYLFGQLFFKTAHKTLKFLEKFKKNAFQLSADLNFKKISSVSTMGVPDRAIELRKQ